MICEKCTNKYNKIRPQKNQSSYHFVAT